ncbi:MAG: hypothetical protein KJS97_06310 [Alphaproteobacteria bacterium]|nr:hypothetical protein [Alphaproteobacteria bacterium]
MAQGVLTDADIANGAAIVRFMEDRGHAITSAFWFYFSDQNWWRLIVATPSAEKGAHPLYLDLLRSGLPIDSVNVAFVAPVYHLVAKLSDAVRVEGLSTVRMSGNYLNGVYVEDALIYRLTKPTAASAAAGS